MQRLVSTQEKLINSMIQKNQDLSITKDLLKNHLYSLEAINKNMNRAILSLAYSPGVGGVCKAIENNHQLIDKYTLRGRSVAVVTNGNFMGVDGSKMHPVMDWVIAQIKYYSNIDAFPFILRKQANLHQVFDDLATSYSMILFLQKDEIDENLLPKNIIFLNQQEIVSCSECEPTDMYFAARILSYSASKNFRGKIKKQDFNKSEEHFNFNFTTVVDYHKPLITDQSVYERAIQYHQYFRGKLQIAVNFHSIEKIKPFFTWSTLQKLVKEDPVQCKTSKVCAIVSNGTAILGYGNIGPEAGLPVMEGKSILFRSLGEVQIVPICVRPKQNPQKEVQSIYNMLGYCKAINLEDFKAPECFAIEQGLQRLKALPIFHDDQHGTAIITLAAAINAFKVAKKPIKQAKVVINGAGAAGITIANLLLQYGVGDLIICDTKGIIHKERKQNMNESKKKLAQKSNKNNVIGNLQDSLDKSDIFIGVSVKDAFKKQWIAKMNDKPIIFALANPDPQITPDLADEGGAFIYGSGRSDYKNQINNSLVFPGVFRAIVTHNIPIITIKMKLKAAEAIANSILEEHLTQQFIVPDSLDKDVALKISEELGNM